MLASVTPTAARGGSLAAVPRLSGPQRQQAAAASQARVATQKQALSGRNGISQRRARAAAARRLTAATVAKAGGDVLVVGSSGQTAARVVVSLLRTGFKVTAGVDTDLEESQEVVKFAKQIEILNKGEAGNLKLAEFNPLDADSIAGVLKRGSRVVLVVGDQAGSRRPDLRIYDAVVEALLENAGRISQLVVVTPLGGGGGGGFFGGGSGGGRMSGLERRVVESGVDFLVVRAAPSDRVTDRYGEQANVVVAPAGRLPNNLQVSRAQVAAVVAEAMAQAKGDAIIEVAASPAAPDAPLRSQVAAALAGAQLQVEVEEEEEEEEAAPAPAKRGGFFTIGGGRKPAPKAVVVEEVEEEEEEEEAPAPVKKPAFGFGGFGTRKITARQPVVVEEEEEEEEEAPAPAPAPKKGFFTLGSRKAAPAPAPVVEEEEEEEEPAPAPAKRGAFAFGSRKGGAAVAVAEEAPPATKRIIRGRAPVAAPEEPKARPAPVQQQPKEEGSAPKKSGGFLGFLGISNETVYADE